jgi:hypothetical protein
VPEANDFDAVVSDAAYYINKELTPELKAAAKQAGWPKEIVDVLSVQFDGKDIYVDYPPKLESQIDNLTYGNGPTSPNPVILPFRARSSETVKSVLANRVVSNLFELEGVFGE